MKVKHIITTCGVILGGLIVPQGASATLTYQTSSDVQFTFNSMLSLALTGDEFLIDELSPGVEGKSNAVEATVSTNSSAGYQLSATVGNSATYTNSDLKGPTVGSGTAKFEMISSGTVLTSGKWGYTINNGSTYGALALYTATTGTILNKTTDQSGTAATGYAGGATTTMKIGAEAASNQTPGTYRNVINFAAVSNVATHNVALALGDHVATVKLGSGSASSSNVNGDYGEGNTVAIEATCASGYDFSGWGISNDYGTIANSSLASTSYTVGGGDVTITAYCLTATPSP